MIFESFPSEVRMLITDYGSKTLLGLFFMLLNSKLLKTVNEFQVISLGTGGNPNASLSRTRGSEIGYGLNLQLILSRGTYAYPISPHNLYQECLGL